MEQPDPIIDVKGCLRRWNKGEESAADELTRYLYPVISRIVRLHLPRRDHEDDIIQEVLIKMFSRLHQYKGDAPLSHWVSKLALRTCFDRLRAQKSRPEICWADLTPEESDVTEIAWLGVPTPDATAAIHTRDLVDKLLSTLTPVDRRLILQVDLEGFSLKEISKRTGWGIPRIKIRLFRSRSYLRKMIKTLEPGCAY